MSLLSKLPAMKVLAFVLTISWQCFVFVCLFLLTKQKLGANRLLQEVESLHKTVIKCKWAARRKNFKCFFFFLAEFAFYQRLSTREVRTSAILQTQIILYQCIRQYILPNVYMVFMVFNRFQQPNNYLQQILQDWTRNGSHLIYRQNEDQAKACVYLFFYPNTPSDVKHFLALYVVSHWNRHSFICLTHKDKLKVFKDSSALHTLY